MGRPSVLVMMAAFNGDRYISQQIDSILAQEGVDVTLLISDDGSTDNTCTICEGYAKRDSRVHFRRNPSNKGLARNFMDMVYDEHSAGFDYYAFSDQDDWWLPEKLLCAIVALKKNTHDEPALYYSDVDNVDENLEHGQREYAGWSNCSHSIIALLVVNWASGCTMVFNPELRKQLLLYIPASYERLHDSWVHLVAIVTGSVVSDLSNSYILRRISSDNRVGVRNLERNASLHAVIRGWRHIFKKSKHVYTHVAKQLYEGYCSKKNTKEAEIISVFVKMPKSVIARIKISHLIIKCSFPSKDMALGYALKAMMNRL